MTSGTVKKQVQEMGGLLYSMVRCFLALERSEICCCGVTMSQCSTIMSVGKNPRMTMQALSQAMALANSTMTRMVDNLVRDGFIERIRDDQDRRIVYVVLTDKGRELFEQISQVMSQYYQTIVQNIPAAERANVLDALRILKDAIDAVPMVQGQQCCSKAE